MRKEDCRLLELTDIENVILKISRVRKENLLPSMSQEETNKLLLEYNFGYRNCGGQLTETQIREMKLFVEYFNHTINPKEPEKRQKK